MELIDLITATINEELNDLEKATSITRRITQVFGGDQIYIPQELSAFREEIEEEIYKEFNGMNTKELARKYHVTPRTIYRIYKKVKSNRLKAEKESQGTLF